MNMMESSGGNNVTLDTIANAGKSVLANIDALLERTGVIGLTESFGSSPILGKPPQWTLVDFEHEILKISEAIRSPFDDVDFGVEAFCYGIGHAIAEIIQDTIEVMSYCINYCIEFFKLVAEDIAKPSVKSLFYLVESACFVIEYWKHLLFEQVCFVDFFVGLH